LQLRVIVGGAQVLDLPRSPPRGPHDLHRSPDVVGRRSVYRRLGFDGGNHS
jgi:hypothetical protein